MVTSSLRPSTPPGISTRRSGRSIAKIVACVGFGTTRSNMAASYTSLAAPSMRAGCSTTARAPGRTRRPDTASVPMPFVPENMSRSAAKTAKCTRSLWFPWQLRSDRGRASGCGRCLLNRRGVPISRAMARPGLEAHARAAQHHKLQDNHHMEVIMAGLPSMFTRGNEGLGSLFREIERTFDDFSRRSPLAGFAGFGDGATAPKVDVSEGKEGIEVTAELPGVDEKDIDLTLSNGVLTIRGEKKTERDETDKEKNWHVVERRYGAFSRAITLPYDPDSSKVEAKFEKGVLRVKLPKPAEITKKEKKIEIRAG